MLTIGIPTYNRPDLLMETIESVLKNDLNGVEILICDNGSYDLTKDPVFDNLFKSHDIKYYLNEKNLGLYQNWDECLEKSTKRYITILNDDDLLLPDFCTKIKSILSKEKLELLFTKSDEFGPNEFLYKTHFGWELFLRNLFAKKKNKKLKLMRPKDMFLGNPVKGCLGVVMKVDTAKSLGGFRTDCTMSADWAFWVNFVQNYRCYYSNEILSHYRYHDNETFKPGITFGFLKDAMGIRSKIIEDTVTKKKFFLKFADCIQFRLQNKRYKYLFSERSPNFFNKINILISRILLRLIIWMA